MAVTIHIIDSCKPSLVMSSEVFKDKLPGALVSFSLTAKDGLAHVQSKIGSTNFDALVVDFNLPDADGVTLIRELRKFYKGPIFMTAYADKIVEHAVQEELFHYHDACCWIPKPVRFETLEKRIEQFLLNRHRLGKRFDVNFPSLMVGKGEGRGKRAPKFDGDLINISMGGLCLSLKEAAKVKRDEEFIVTMGVPAGTIDGATGISLLTPILAPVVAPKVIATKMQAKTPTQAVKAKALKLSTTLTPKKIKELFKGRKLTPAQKAKEISKLRTQEKIRFEAARAAQKQAELAAQKQAELVAKQEAELAKLAAAAVAQRRQNLEEYKIKATVAWIADGGKKIGLQFTKIPDTQRRQIEVFLKGLSA